MKRYVILGLCALIYLLPVQLFSWYPDYSVLATELKLEDDFLSPLTMNSTDLQGLGKHFQFLYPGQADLRFIDPTYPLLKGKHFFYMDLGSEQVWESNASVDPWGPYYSYSSSSSVLSDYSFWSPYREYSHEAIPEPSFRLFYLTRLGDSPKALTLGASYALSYDETEFYQPYSYDYFRSYDAFGAANAESSISDDYRLKEAGDDESISKEYQGNIFVSKHVTDALTVGARFGVKSGDVDASFRDFQSEDQNNWSNEYLYFYDNDITRIQTSKLTDLNLGLAYTTVDNKRFALSGGLTDGRLERNFNQADTNQYYSLYLNPDQNITTLDSNINQSSSFYKHDKEWAYSGNGKYLNFISEIPGSEGVIYRLGGTAEWRSADLTESESMLRHSDNFYQYWMDNYNSWQQYESESMTEVDRAGTGSFESKDFKFSAGVELQLQPNLKFYGGLYSQYSESSQDARESFDGEKHSESNDSGYDLNPTNRMDSQWDDKVFIWHRDQITTIISAPLGIEHQILPALGLQLGVTKVFQKTRIEESYDVEVSSYRRLQIINDVALDENDENYTDGYQYPSIKEFSDRFEFNAGVRVDFKDKLRVNANLTHTYNVGYSVKVGASISW